MMQLTNDEKAKLYNQMLFQYERLQEQVRQIKAGNFELNEQDSRKVQQLEAQMRKIYNDTRKLYN